MLEDIFNIPLELEINGKKYKAEYDFKGYAVLETLTGKGFYKLYNLLMIQNNLTLNDSVEIVCCSLLNKFPMLRGLCHHVQHPTRQQKQSCVLRIM